MFYYKRLLFTFILVFPNIQAKSDMHNANADKQEQLTTSIISLTKLMQKEYHLMECAYEKLQEFEYKITQFSKILVPLYMDHTTAFKDPEYFLSNPLHSFQLIRRLYDEWPKWLALLREPLKHVPSDKMFLKKFSPEFKDLENAVLSIQRIQSVYNVHAQDFAKAYFNDKQYGGELSSKDCITISDILNKNGFRNDSLNWLTLAMKKQKENGENEALDAEIVKNILKEPENKNEYSKSAENAPILIKYKNMCRGEFTPPNDSNLKCFMKSDGAPFLILAPFKTEELSLDPYIVLYYDVISDEEIWNLKHEAIPHLTDAGVKIGNKFAVSSYRTAKSAEIGLSETVLRLNRRIEHMTGLNLTLSESLQPINYGIGGHYSCHPDALVEVEEVEHMKSIFLKHGGRIATVILYLSDVKEGGATVFPLLNISIAPRKGTAAYWHNMQNDQKTCNMWTLHCGCPAIIGAKWIAAKWIKSRDQMFRLPCKRFT